jgi:hypothetical protein
MEVGLMAAIGLLAGYPFVNFYTSGSSNLNKI